MGMLGYLAAVKAQSASTAFTDEACGTTDDTVYTITDTTKDIWDYNATFVVEDGAVPTTESYTLDYLEGKITFLTVDNTRVITVTGEYVTLTAIATAQSFSFAGSADVADVTTFQTTKFKSFKLLKLSATAELGRLYATDDYFLDLLIAGTVKVIEYYPVHSGTPIRFFGVPIGEVTEADVNGIVMESISYQISKNATLLTA